MIQKAHLKKTPRVYYCPLKDNEDHLGKGTYFTENKEKWIQYYLQECNSSQHLIFTHSRIRKPLIQMSDKREGIGATL